MKKTIALLLAVMMLFAVASCTEQPATNNDENQSAYAELSIMEGVELGVEEYGIAFRAGSDMTAKVDAISKDLFADGTITAIAEKYDVKAQLVPEFKAAEGQQTSGDSDWEYIKNKGTLVIGVTDYKPMDYMENGKWIGFDAEYAEKVCEKLGVKAEFKEIVWENKLLDLETKTIDCVWNGMTIKEEITNTADVSGAYMKNYQVVIVKDAETYKDLASLNGKKIVAEAGSAGETEALANENLKVGYKAVESMADALLEVKSGAADACVIDYVMAASLVG